MNPATLFATALFALAAAPLAEACTPLRVGYIDQHRPPYYMGTGGELPDPPGASVELMRDIVDAGGCRVQLVRMPLLRLRPALEAGLIDAAAVDPSPKDAEAFALPRDRSGKPDSSKALAIHSIIFVRSADRIKPDTDPMAFLRERTLGASHGAPYAEDFRKAGINVDDGAMDVPRNLDKLLRKRIDAFVTTLTAANEMDSYIEQNWGGQITRLDKPVRVAYVYFAVNKDYYSRNKDRVDTMWRWVGSSGRQRFDQLLKKYDKNKL